MTFGFALRRLALIGPGKAPAEVTFTRGLNVIAGDNLADAAQKGVA